MTKEPFRRILFKVASYVEKAAAAVQGKGYGAATIRQETHLVFKLLEDKPSLAVDIGGNVGEYSADLRRRASDVEIHVFEPSVTNIALLKKRFADDRNIFVLPFAVSDKPAVATLYSNEAGSGLGSLTQRRLEHFNIDFNVTEVVTAIRFEDYWINDLNNRQLDLVKIDIEGHELQALSGFGKAIFATRLIQFEFGGCNIDTRTYFQDFWYFFKEHDFSLFRITPFGLEKIQNYTEWDECFLTTNFIALNRR